MKRIALICLLSTAALVSNAQSMPYGLNGKTMLLLMKEVKKEINLTKDQQKQIDEYNKELGKDPSSVGMMDMHYMTKTMDKKIEGFLDDAQRARLQELFLQYNGLMTLTEEEVSGALGLSDEVTTTAKSIIKASDKELIDELMAHKGKFDKKKMAEIRDKATADLTALLTPEQVEKWKTLQGKPFKFPKQ